MLEIRPRHHAEGGPLLRHVRTPRPDPRRRRRRARRACSRAATIAGSCQPHPRRMKMPPTTSPATCWSRCAARSSPRSTAARSPRSTSAMDDAIDEMWQTAKAITLYEVASFAPQMTEMAGLAAEAARLVAEAVPLMRNIGRNAGRLHELTEAIVHLEGKADELLRCRPQGRSSRRATRAGRWPSSSAARSTSISRRCSTGSRTSPTRSRAS